jgi:hypothetical protein
LACSAQSNSRPANPPPWHEESSSPTPQNQGQTKVSTKPGAAQGMASHPRWQAFATPQAGGKQVEAVGLVGG